LFVVVSRYAAPISELDEAMAAHRDFLRTCYSRGVFILSGPREPRNGGIILARAGSEAGLRRILDQDPFRRGGLIEYDLFGWSPTFRASGLPPDLFAGTEALAADPGLVDVDGEGA